MNLIDKLIDNVFTFEGLKPRQVSEYITSLYFWQDNWAKYNCTDANHRYTRQGFINE